MSKRNVKIVILFLLIVIVLIAGWSLYRRLEYNKQSFSANINDYISPLAEEVIYINKGYGIDEIYSLYPYTKELIDVFGGEYSPPIAILKYKNEESVLLAKASIDQELTIKDFIKNSISPYYPVKKRKYKDAEILFYSLPNNNFLICSFYKGIFAISKNYKPIEIFIDSDPENTFFSNENNKEIIERILANPSINIFTHIEQDMLAVNYTIHNDSITLAGYVLRANEIASDSVSPDYSVIPYMINIPDSLCIEDYTISEENKPISMKIFINKKF